MSSRKSSAPAVAEEREDVGSVHGFPARVQFDGSWQGDADIAAVRHALAESKAVLIRRTGIDDAVSFAAFAEAVIGPLANDRGEHSRVSSGAGVFSPVEFDHDQKLLWHNENTFDRHPPSAIALCCLRPAAHGGETPVVLGSDVFADLPESLVDEFMTRGVCYVRRFHPGIGRPWTAIFGTDDRDEVEEICRERGLEYEWHGDLLSTFAVRPVAHFDHSRHVWSWISQAQHWHPSSLPITVRESIRAMFGNEPPRDCTFGDGGAIGDEAMTTILDAYARHEHVNPWAAGDVLIVDNLNVAHGRNPFTGRRDLLVALGPQAAVMSDGGRADGGR
jgi:hypothetical protein